MSETFDHTEFRRILGNFATGVVIVTAIAKDGPVGMTIGAFTSVSLAPPLIAFLPAKTSHTWPKIREAGKFTVNILSNDQEAICREFAQTSNEKFDRVPWELSDHETPHIIGALAWLDCGLHYVFEAGDHHIALGRVRSLGHGPNQKPLVFYRGRFHHLVPNEIGVLERPRGQD